MGRLFEKTWEKIDENKEELEERVIALEEHTGIAHSN